MVNKQRGYVTIEIGGQEYVLRYDFNALAQLEERLGQSIVEVLGKGNIGFRFVREALIVGLRNPVNGRSAAEAANKLEPSKFSYYFSRIVDALIASGLLEESDDRGEAAPPAATKTDE